MDGEVSIARSLGDGGGGRINMQYLWSASSMVLRSAFVLLTLTITGSNSRDHLSRYEQGPPGSHDTYGKAYLSARELLRLRPEGGAALPQRVMHRHVEEHEATLCRYLCVVEERQPSRA